MVAKAMLVIIDISYAKCSVTSPIECWILPNTRGDRLYPKFHHIAFYHTYHSKMCRSFPSCERIYKCAAGHVRMSYE